ncbi:MAG: pyridoxal phosphate-dependent aminotransferase [Propionibacteriaceae bacterium]|jgi:cystathionine beta-lyase|nr:pyridoxal phosphate-dependent aminotransferase [Propionibacteriaceae bacterium]
MFYDFATVIDRRGTNSMKWSIGADELPMWVADMDFPSAPAILEAVQAKLRLGVFGYEVVPPEFADSIISWWGTRYGTHVEREWICFCDGVIPGVTSAVSTMTEPGDGILVQSPVYDCFYILIRESERNLVINELRYVPVDTATNAQHDGSGDPSCHSARSEAQSQNPENCHPRYEVDWDDLEAKFADPGTKVFLLCNPHNPTGQLWTVDELTRIRDLSRTHDVLVISDEIHCDITEPGVTYTPYVQIDPESITVISPSKSFNIPGLQGAALIIPSPSLRTRVATGLHRDGIHQPGTFAAVSTIAAYNESGEWLDQMRDYVWANRAHLESFIADKLPQLSVVPSQSTYLAWVDCSGLTRDATKLTTHLRQTTGLVINPGAKYGANSPQFIRINLACPQSILDDGLTRLVQGVSTWPSTV